VGRREEIFNFVIVIYAKPEIMKGIHNMKTDVVIVGAGPAGIFTAIEMIRLGTKKKILIVEKGAPIEQRRCPKEVTKRCVDCKPYCISPQAFRVPVHSLTVSSHSLLR
jgi:uncharacterized FAD-dependent dehydrogenase